VSARQNGQHGGRPTQGFTFAEFVGRVYWPAKGTKLARATWARVTRTHDRLVDTFGTKPIDAITPEDVLAWWSRQQEQYGYEDGNRLVIRREAATVSNA
jgi:hypothetical protein